MAGFSDDFPMTMEREAGMPDYCPPVAVGFGMHPMLDDRKTEEAGYEVYRDVVFVKITVPGDRNMMYFQPAQDSHKKRFPRSWAEFSARTSEVREGMPIEQWAPIGRAMAMTLKAAHIHTVEALAAVHDGHIDKLGFAGRELRAKAQAFLAQAKDSAAVTAAASREQKLQDQIAALQAQITALAAGKGAKEAKPTAPPSVPSVAQDEVTEEVAAAVRKPRRKAA